MKELKRIKLRLDKIVEKLEELMEFDDEITDEECLVEQLELVKEHIVNAIGELELTFE